MLKVAIIGCGKIADTHAAQIQRVSGCVLAAACDREELMARQLAERFGVEAVFSDVGEMLHRVRPDVVHITTPPQTHFQLASLALKSGSNVYVEKPFTVDTPEAERLIELAEARGLKMTVGHDLQHSHVSRRARKLIQEGYLGGEPVHMESYYGYDMGEAGYAKALLSDTHHWVRKLPGKLLHNVISHGVARIAEHLATETPQVVAHGFISPLLRRLGETEVVDELRVIISESQRTTAYFTFSSQMRPPLNQFRMLGPKNGLLLDYENETLIRLKGSRYKSYAEHFLAPVALARQYGANTWTNFRSFLRNDFHMRSGMKNLIEAFYDSVGKGGPLPISYREILLTSRIMDSIFEQLESAGPSRNGSVAENAPQMQRA